MLRITHPVLALLAEAILTKEEQRLFSVNDGSVMCAMIPQGHASFKMLEERIKQMEHLLGRLKALYALALAAKTMGLFDQKSSFLEEV